MKNAILENLSQPALYATAVGILAGNLLEVNIIKSQRATFGYALPDGTGGEKFTADGEGKTSLPNASTSRQLLRGGLVLVALAVVAYVPDKSGVVKGAALGIAAVELAHVVQGFFPALKM
jgi:hypothetical protein